MGRGWGAWPITYFSIYRSNRRGGGGLVFLALEGGLPAPPMGPGRRGSAGRNTYGEQPGQPGPPAKAEMTKEEVTLRLNRKGGPGERQAGQAAGPCAGLGAVLGSGSGSWLPLQA